MVDSSSSLLSSLLPEFVRVFEELRSSGVKIREGVIFDHQELLAEYSFHIGLGLRHSRLDGLKALVSSALQGTVEIENVVEASAIGLPDFEELGELGVIVLESSKLRISFSELIRKVNSSLVVIRIKKRIANDIRDKIVTFHVSQNARVIGDKSLFYFEVVLDYADLWKKSVDSFSVQNIVFPINLEVIGQDIEPLLPEPFKERLRRADHAVLSGNRSAIEFLNSLNREFLSFESNETIREFYGMIGFSPPTVAEVLDITPRMQPFQLGDSNYPLILPGSLQVRIKTKIPENEAKQVGSVEIDLSHFKLFVERVVRRVEQATIKLVF